MKKIISLIVIGVLMFSAIGIMTGCDPDKDIYVEGKQWNYYKLRRGKDGVALTRLKDESLIVDGVLTIPTKVDGYKVTQLTGKRGARGIPGTASGVFSTRIRADDGTFHSAEQIIIPEGIEIDQLFWHFEMAQTIIIMDKNPDLVSFSGFGIAPSGMWNRPITIVVYDGCYESLYTKFAMHIEEGVVDLIEHSMFLQI